MFKFCGRILCALGLVAVSSALVLRPAMAQEQQGTTAQTKVSGWNAQCSSASRGGDLICTVEQGIYLSDTGQQLARVALRVPADASKVDAVIHLPHGLNLPKGVQLKFDGGTAETHQVQTCDAQGCYVIVKDAARLAVSMKGGKELELAFENLNGDAINVAMPLEGFTAAYKRAE